MVAAWMLGRQNLSLKGLAWRELGANVIDYEEAIAAGGDVWLNYCAQDPVLTYRLHEKLYAELRAKGIAWLYDNVEMPLQPLLAEMSLYGLEVDHERVIALWASMDKRMEILLEAMRAEAGADFNPDSPQQVLKYIRSLGLRIESTDEDTLLGVKNAPLFVRHLLAYRKAYGRIKVLRVLSEHKTISGLFNPTGTQTGRLSQTSRNLQNLTAEIKRCIKAPDGYLFVYRDYSQIEVRLAAYLSRDKYLLGALREGRNIHEELCLSVYGYRIPELYTLAKSANFERLYCGSLGTRAEKLGVSQQRLAAKEVPWVEFDQWTLNQRANARTTGEARTHRNRMMLLHGIDSSDKKARDDAERQAVNMPEQGGASDIVKEAMVIASPWMKELGGRVAHQEHDSILCIAPERLAKEADTALDEAMTLAVPQELRDVIPFPSKSIISTHWG
jgi:DNA polymerase-1